MKGKNCLNTVTYIFLVPVVTEPANGHDASTQHDPVILATNLLYIGEHMIWQKPDHHPW